MRLVHFLSAQLAALLALGPAPAQAAGVDIAWCTGLSPISWGFSVEPTAACSSLQLTLASTTVDIISARPGPGLPEGWTVSAEGRSVIARGSAPVPTGERRDALVVVETSRGTSRVDGRGATGIAWDATLAGPDATGAEVSQTTRLSPPGMLELTDAVSRGLVLATMKARSPLGPVEITVDNPTLAPLWLDLPPGLTLSADGEDWIVGLVRPYRLLQKQKLGRTVTAFPVSPPPPGRAAPRRLAWGGRRHARATDVTATALAVDRLQEASARGTRNSGPFEYSLPFDFWPVVLQWSFWNSADEPPSFDVLAGLVKGLIENRALAGDERAAALDVIAAAREADVAAREVLQVRETLRGQEEALEEAASLERSR